MMQLHNQLM